jgi:hypothetical protein
VSRLQLGTAIRAKLDYGSINFPLASLIAASVAGGGAELGSRIVGMENRSCVW